MFGGCNCVIASCQVGDSMSGGTESVSNEYIYCTSFFLLIALPGNTVISYMNNSKVQLNKTPSGPTKSFLNNEWVFIVIYIK